jgi:hypothetical protein
MNKLQPKDVDMSIFDIINQYFKEIMELSKPLTWAKISEARDESVSNPE